MNINSNIFLTVLLYSVFADEPKPMSVNQEISVENSSVISSNTTFYDDGFYKHLRGSIGNEQITMDLTVTSRHALPQNLVIGAYSYNNTTGLRLFEGSSIGDSLVFIEKENILEVARFALKISQNQLEGTRFDFKTKEVTKVRLSEVNSKVKFLYWGARDSIDIIKEGNKLAQKNNIQAHFYMYFERHYLIPQSSDARLDTAIMGSLARLFPQETFSSSVQSVFDTHKMTFLKEKLSLFTEKYPNGIDALENLSNYFTDSQLDKRTYFVLYNDEGFLMLAYIYPLQKFLEYRRTRVVSFDIQKRKIIHLEDFLEKKQKKMLDKIIEKDINLHFSHTENPKNIGGEEDIVGYTQYVGISEDGDFGICPKGLFIAGFKKNYGDMPWTLHLEQVQSVIKPHFYNALVR